MNKIQYHYTNLAKQLFFAVCFLFTLLRFIVISQVHFYKLEGFYENVNYPLTLIMYAISFVIIYMLFRGHKYCYSTYDENSLTYRNTLLRKEKKLDYSQIKLAVFDTFGVKFYDKENINPKKDKPFFFLPFFRAGIIEAIQIDKFFRMMKDREDITVIKNFKVLPGYSKKWKWLTILYGFMAVILFMTLSTPITTIIVLFQNH